MGGCGGDGRDVDRELQDAQAGKACFHAHQQAAQHSHIDCCAVELQLLQQRVRQYENESTTVIVVLLLAAV